LVVSTHLKSISQIGSFPQVGVKIENIRNHSFPVAICLTPQLYGLGYPRNLPPSYPNRGNFFLISLKTSTDRLQEDRESVSGARQLGWASCIASAGGVTLAGETTFLHINNLAHQTETILGLVSVTK